MKPVLVKMECLQRVEFGEAKTIHPGPELMFSDVLNLLDSTERNKNQQEHYLRLSV